MESRVCQPAQEESRGTVAQRMEGVSAAAQELSDEFRTGEVVSVPGERREGTSAEAAQ